MHVAEEECMKVTGVKTRRKDMSRTTWSQVEENNIICLNMM
jgi:hypothetical protein